MTTVIVTHDQEEAMEVADEIVVLYDGRVQQVGHPHDVYEHPANEWVMSFLGPVTHFGSLLVRPHDLDLAHETSDGALPATVVRVTRLGFQTVVDLDMQGGADLCAARARGDGPIDAGARHVGVRESRARRRASCRSRVPVPAAAARDRLTAPLLGRRHPPAFLDAARARARTATRSGPTRVADRRPTLRCRQTVRWALSAAPSTCRSRIPHCTLTGAGCRSAIEAGGDGAGVLK